MALTSRLVVALSASFLAVAVFPLPTTGQTAVASPTNALGRCNDIEEFANTHIGDSRLFGDVASESAPTTDWKGFKSDDALRAADTGENLAEVARVWVRGGKVVLARFFFSSSSGDWSDTVDYCFDESGNLSRARSELRTFYGNVRKKRDMVPSPAGRFVETDVEVLGLTSGKPVVPPESFIDHKVPLFETIKALPFYSLLGAA